MNKMRWVQLAAFQREISFSWTTFALRRTRDLKSGGVFERCERRRRWDAGERKRLNDGRGGGASGRGERDGDREDEGDDGLGDESNWGADGFLGSMVEAILGWIGSRVLVF